MTSLKKSQHPYLQTAGLIAGGTSLVLAALAYKYPNRPMFSDCRDDILNVDALPLIGITPAIFKHRQTIHDYFASLVDRFDEMTG
jgi:hypothetical protein